MTRAPSSVDRTPKSWMTRPCGVLAKPTEMMTRSRTIPCACPGPTTTKGCTEAESKNAASPGSLARSLSTADRIRAAWRSERAMTARERSGDSTPWARTRSTTVSTSVVVVSIALPLRAGIPVPAHHTAPTGAFEAVHGTGTPLWPSP